MVVAIQNDILTQRLQERKKGEDDILSQRLAERKAPIRPILDADEETKRFSKSIDAAIELDLSLLDVEQFYGSIVDDPQSIAPPKTAEVPIQTIAPWWSTEIPEEFRKPADIGMAIRAPRIDGRGFWKWFWDERLVTKRPPLPPNADRMEKIDRAFDIALGGPLRLFLKISKGLTLNIPDVLWAGIKRITPDEVWTDEVRQMNLDEAMDWAAGYNPSGFQKMMGEIGEFAGRINTISPLLTQYNIWAGVSERSLSVLEQAAETALLFGGAAAIEQGTGFAAEQIDPTEAEYGYQGATAVLRDMAIGAAFSLVFSGVKGAWSKLTPSEHARALKVLGLKKGATQAEITKAAKELALKTHPDKVKGLREEFVKVITARDTLRTQPEQDIIFRGQKVKFTPKLLPGEKVVAGKIVKAEVPIKPPVKPVAPITKPEAPVIARPSIIRAKYNKADIQSATEAVKRTNPTEDRYIYATAQGFVIDRNPPIDKNQAYRVVHPDYSYEDVQPFAEGEEARIATRRKVLQERVKRGEPTPEPLLREFKGEKWAQEALAKPPVTAPKVKIVPRAEEIIVKPAPEGTYNLYRDGKWIGNVPARTITGERIPPERAIADWREYQLAKAPVIAPKVVKPKKKIVKPKAEEVRDILGGVDPIFQIHTALKSATAVQPVTEAQKKATLRARVGAAIGAMKSNVKKGVPTEEAIFKSTGLLKGPLAEYDQVYTSIEDILEPGAKEAGYQKIYHHPGLKYFEVVNTTTAFKKLLAGSALTPGDVEMIERVFGRAFQDITDVRMTRSGLYERLIALWKAGLLTGIKTSGLNILSTASHAVSETAKDVPAAFIDRIASLFTGERTLAFTARGYPKGFAKEGVKKGWTYLTTGIDARNVGQKLDYKKVNFGNSKIAKALQAYEETIFHLLGAEDQPFFYGAKARSLYSQAIAQAMNKGLKGKERLAYVNNAIANPTDDMLEWAVFDAEVAVFQNRTHLGDIARSIQKVKGGEVVVPFGRTPAAVATQIISYTPIGIVKEIAHEISTGKFNQRKFSQAFGRTVVGTGVLYIGTLLLKAGLISLDYPDTERERELWKIEGRKENSIKVGDKWRSAHLLGPIGNALLIGGHFQEALNAEGSPTKAIVTALAGGAKSFSEQTFVRGINMAVDALVSPERSFENWFSSMAGSLVPTIVGDFARALDERERRAIGLKERIQKRIPILRERLEPAIDVFGQDLPRYGGNVLETMADPTRPSKIRQDVVVDELRRLFDKGIKVSPTLLGDKAGYDILTKEENTILWRRAGELTYKGLLAQINDRNYKKADDRGKGTLIEFVIGRSRALAKAEIVHIKLAQGKTILELAESGLFTIDGLEAIKYFRDLEGPSW